MQLWPGLPLPASLRSGGSHLSFRAHGAEVETVRAPLGSSPALSCPTRALSQLTGDRGRRQGRSWQQMQMSGSMQLITGNVQEQIEK